MAANLEPIFPLTPVIGSVPCGGAANTRSDGNGTIATDIFKVFTAGANGSFVERIRISPVATVAATATTATTIRIFVSNKTSGATTSADTFLIQEIGAAAQTADHSTNATFFFDIPLNIKLPAGWTILVTNHVINAANTSWQAVVFAMDY